MSGYLLLRRAPARAAPAINSIDEGSGIPACWIVKVSMFAPVPQVQVDVGTSPIEAIVWPMIVNVPDIGVPDT